MKEQDVEGKELFKRFLEHFGYTDICFTGEFDFYDMYAKDPEGTICYYELKKRTAPHNNPFGDTIIEKPKFNKLKTLQSSNTKVFVVNIFLDNILTIIPLDSPHSEQVVYAQKTNNWSNEKVKKTFISYPNDKEYLYTYFPKFRKLR